MQIFKGVLLCTCLVAASAFAALAQDDAPVFDVEIETTGVTDYFDSGLTNSDHKPSGGVTITPSYGIFYGTLYGATIDYGTDEPRVETKFAIGMTPTWGNLSVDFNLARRIHFDEPADDRWLPYVTGSYTFNDNFTAGLGIGYYAYDDPATADFWEYYAHGTVTLDNATYFTGELYWEPNSDGFDNDYYAAYGTLGVPFLEKFELVGKVGYEGYQDRISTPPYTWYEASLAYNFNDHLALAVGYHGNDLSSADCPAQAYTDCDGAVFAKVTFKAKLSDLVAKKPE